MSQSLRPTSFMKEPEKKTIPTKPNSFNEESQPIVNSFEELPKPILAPKKVEEKIEKVEEKKSNNLPNEPITISKIQTKRTLFNENNDLEKSSFQEKSIKKSEPIPQEKNLKSPNQGGISQSFIEPSLMMDRRAGDDSNNSKMKELEEKKRQLEIRKREIEEKRKNLQQYSSPAKKETKLEEAEMRFFEDPKIEKKEEVKPKVEKKDEVKQDPIKVDQPQVVEKPVSELVPPKKEVKVETEKKKELKVEEKIEAPKVEEKQEVKLDQFKIEQPQKKEVKIPVVEKIEEKEEEKEEFVHHEVKFVEDDYMKKMEVNTPEESFEVKDDEVTNILNDFATPNVKRKSNKLTLENHHDIQKNAIFNTKKMINSMLSGDYFDANLGIELEFLSKRLENLEERSYFLQNNKKRFKELEIEDMRGYESSFDNLMRISIISERIKFREERLKIAEKLFELEWKHESDSSKLFGKSNFPKPTHKQQNIPNLKVDDSKIEKNTESEQYITPREQLLSKTGRVSIDSTKLKDDDDLLTNDTMSEMGEDEKKTPKPKQNVEEAKVIQSPQGISGRHMKLYVEIPQNVSKSKQMEIQSGQCAGCSVVLKDTIFNRPRFCYYTYKYYCNECHKNEVSYLPHMILHNWDFRENYVCVMAKNYLEQIYMIPMICISAINPSLFDKVPNLNKSRLIRKRLNIQWDIINDCENKDSLFETLKLDNYSNYLTNTEIYSIQNLEHLNRPPTSSPFLKKLSKLFSLLSDHITQNCKYCKKKAGRICSVCYDPTPIYAFNISTVNQCPNCTLVYHKDCFKTKTGVTGCPNCSNEK